MPENGGPEAWISLLAQTARLIRGYQHLERLQRDRPDERQMRPLEKLIELIDSQIMLLENERTPPDPALRSYYSGALILAAFEECEEFADLHPRRRLAQVRSRLLRLIEGDRSELPGLLRLFQKAAQAADTTLGPRNWEPTG